MRMSTEEAIFVDLYMKVCSTCKPFCICRLWLLSSNVHVLFSFENKEKAFPLKVKCLTMAGDLQIISIDHGSNRAECRADSKIRST